MIFELIRHGCGFGVRNPDLAPFLSKEDVQVSELRGCRLWGGLLASAQNSDYE